MANTGTDRDLEEEKNESRESTNLSQSQFDELATLYEEMFAWPFRRDIEIPNTMRVIGDVSNLSILDFGCGTGTHSRLLKRAGAARVVGFDPCLRMLEYAKEKAINAGAEIEFISELVPEIYNGQFDLVLGVYVLPYASTRSELDDMCSRMGNLLKPGGRLITLPVHPECNPNPDYYEEYGFRMAPQKQSNESYGFTDGGPIDFHICYEKWDVRLEPTYWSRVSLTNALVGAGFSSVSQIDLFRENLNAFMVKYVNQPHASLIECKK